MGMKAVKVYELFNLETGERKIVVGTNEVSRVVGVSAWKDVARIIREEQVSRTGWVIDEVLTERDLKRKANGTV